MTTAVRMQAHRSVLTSSVILPEDVYQSSYSPGMAQRVPGS